MLTSCRKDNVDAYGNFEATEVTVAAEVGGRLVVFKLEEGDRLKKGASWARWTRCRFSSSGRRWWRAGLRAAPAPAKRAPTSRPSTSSAPFADRELARTERLLRRRPRPRSRATGPSGRRGWRASSWPAPGRAEGAAAGGGRARRPVAQLDDRLARAGS